MKIGIITIIDNQNYGNRLQNYALDMLLKEMGHEPITGIICYCKQDWELRSKNRFVKLIKSIIPFWMYRINIIICRFKVKECLKTKVKKRREERFKEFNNSHLRMFPVIIVKNNEQLSSTIFEQDYNFFISGSDQVWNPNFAGHSYNFLSFTSSKKKLSFAASFGTNEIPDFLIDYYKNSLLDYKWISVREKSAKELIESFVDNKVDVVLDPTLLISKRDWDTLSRQPNINLPSEYICVYVLGEMPKAVSLFAQTKNLPVIELNSRNFPELYAIGPEEFLYVIKSASYVLTDSFHAFVFSLIFNKQFYVFNRKQEGFDNMFSRIEEIVDEFGLNDHIQNNDIIKEGSIISEKKWESINNTLNMSKKNTISLLEKQLHN